MLLLLDQYLGPLLKLASAKLMPALARTFVLLFELALGRSPRHPLALLPCPVLCKHLVDIERPPVHSRELLLGFVQIFFLVVSIPCHTYILNTLFAFSISCAETFSTSSP